MRKPNSTNCAACLKHMVQTDTSQPAGNEAVLVTWIESLFRGRPVETRRFDHGANRASLLVRLPGSSDAGGVGFFAHLDTVAFGDPAQWAHPPLGCNEQDGVLYGRGTADMKGGASAILEMALCLLDNQVALQKPVTLCFTADEEASGIGANAIVKDPWVTRMEEMFICEPSDEQIGIGEKGALWLHVDVTGKQAHGSRPEIGINALEHAAVFQQRLREAVDTKTSHPLLGSATISLTKLEGGIMTNVIPASAMFELDIRTLPAHSHSQILGAVRLLAAEQQRATPGLTFNITVLNDRPAVDTDRDHPFVKRVRAVASAAGLNSDCRGMLFYTDASQLIPPLGTPFVILGPGDDKQAHQTDEHIALDSITRFAHLYYDYVVQNCT